MTFRSHSSVVAVTRIITLPVNVLLRRGNPPQQCLFGPRLAVEVDLGVSVDIASRPRSYAEALRALSQGDRLVRLADHRTPLALTLSKILLL